MTTTPDVTDTSWDSATVRAAEAEAKDVIKEIRLRGLDPQALSANDREVYDLADHVLKLVNEVRQLRQMHSDSIEAYRALRRRVRDAIAADDLF